MFTLKLNCGHEAHTATPGGDQHFCEACVGYRNVLDNTEVVPDVIGNPGAIEDAFRDVDPIDGEGSEV